MKFGPHRLSVHLFCTGPCRTLTSAAFASSCTSGSETRSSLGSPSVSGRWPGELSLGQTGISGG